MNDAISSCLVDNFEISVLFCFFLFDIKLFLNKIKSNVLI